MVKSQLPTTFPLAITYVKYPNGSCEPILDIYISKGFQWYKELFNLMSFDPWNCVLKIQKSIGTPTPKVKTHLGVWGFIPSHSPTLPGTWKCDFRASHLACTFASPYLSRKPKAKVATPTMKKYINMFSKTRTNVRKTLNMVNTWKESSIWQM
jgi:hypothetical protein